MTDFKTVLKWFSSMILGHFWSNEIDYFTEIICATSGFIQSEERENPQS